MAKDTVLITVGHPYSKIPALPMVQTLVDEKGEIAAAKKLRKMVADNPQGYGYTPGIKFSPSDFYWAVFDSTTDKNPRLHSDNYYWGVNGYESQGKNPDGTPYYDVGYYDAKNGQFNLPDNGYNKSLYIQGWEDYNESHKRLLGDNTEDEMLGEIA